MSLKQDIIDKYRSQIDALRAEIADLKQAKQIGAISLDKWQQELNDRKQKIISLRKEREKALVNMKLDKLMMSAEQEAEYRNRIKESFLRRQLNAKTKQESR